MLRDPGNIPLMPLNIAPARPRKVFTDQIRRAAQRGGIARSLHLIGDSAWGRSMKQIHAGRRRAALDLEGLRRIGREAAAMRKRRNEYERQQRSGDLGSSGEMREATSPPAPSSPPAGKGKRRKRGT